MAAFASVDDWSWNISTTVQILYIQLKVPTLHAGSLNCSSTVEQHQALSAKAASIFHKFMSMHSCCNIVVCYVLIIRVSGHDPTKAFCMNYMGNVVLQECVGKFSVKLGPGYNTMLPDLIPCSQKCAGVSSYWFSQTST